MQVFYACDLYRDLRVSVKVSIYEFRFQKVFITLILIELYLFYLAQICIRTRPYYAFQKLTPATLTLTAESVLWFGNLRLGFKKCSWLPYQLRYTFYVWHTYALGQNLYMHTNIFTPVNLTLTSESAFRFNICVKVWTIVYYSHANWGLPFIYGTQMH